MQLSSHDPPDDVYLDTDVVVNGAIADLANSTACLKARSQIRTHGTTVWFSAILRVEFAQAVRTLATQSIASPELIAEFDLERWSDRSVRQRWHRYGLSALEIYLARLPHVAEIPLSRSIIEQSVEIMARYGLRSLDAVHVATALNFEIPVFWTCDDHFRRVTEIEVEIIR